MAATSLGSINSDSIDSFVLINIKNLGILNSCHDNFWNRFDLFEDFWCWWKFFNNYYIPKGLSHFGESDQDKWTSCSKENFWYLPMNCFTYQDTLVKIEMEPCQQNWKL